MINLYSKKYFESFLKRIQGKTGAKSVARSIFSASLFAFIFLPGSNFSGSWLYSQEIQNGNADSTNSTTISNQNQDTSQKDENKTNGESVVENSADSKNETKKAETKEVVPSVYTNPVMQNRLNDQYRWTPEDPSFLYETRNIPDHKNKQEFLPSELEKVEVREQIKDEVNFRKSLEKIKIRLPDMTQTLILVSIIIVILIYRSRVRKQHGSR